MPDIPPPLTPPDCDLRDLDGFLLNVEKLMASELVALSSHEVIGAAMLLWCRAWKQMPAASLPEDDRVNAAFARLPLARFRKIKADVMRGFVLCSDGRLYHRTLSDEAIKAWTKKQAFQRKRETDAERLREWRRKVNGNVPETPRETPDETQSETRFVAEVREGKVRKEKKDNPPTTPPATSDAEKLVEVVEGFSEFWELYPRKVAKAAALKAYRAALKRGAKPEEMLAALRVYRESETVRKGFPAHAATWLNGERWKDEIDAKAQPEQELSEAEKRERHDRAKLESFAACGLWLPRWGGKPGEPGCDVPQALIDELLGADWQSRLPQEWARRRASA